MWIDAICMNQTNNLERAQQVGIMKDIYKKAMHVVIWLGKETAEDADTFNLLSRFEKLFKAKGMVPVGVVENHRLELPAENSEEWTTLVRLFQRPWFQRIWVLQEAGIIHGSENHLCVWLPSRWMAAHLSSCVVSSELGNARNLSS